MKFLIFLGIFVTVGTLVAGAPKDSKDEPKPKDWFENIIKDTIGMTVKELLSLTQTTFKDLNSVTAEGMSKLDEVYDQAKPEVKEELFRIKEEMDKKMFSILNNLLGDLGEVLPNLTSIPGSPKEEDGSPVKPFSAADIIRSILGITLENFVIGIANSLQICADLLTRTMQEFENLQTQANPEVAAVLRLISEQYLLRGKMVVMPVLDTLRQVV